MTELGARYNAVFLKVSARVSAWARQYSLLAHLLDARAAYSADEMAILAASLAYYSLLALFPLILLLIALTSPFIASDRVVQDTARFVRNYLPSAGAEVQSILPQVLEQRGPATIFGALALLWSSSGIFDVLQRALNRAFHVTRWRPYWRQRGVSIAIVIGLVLFFAISLFISAVTRVNFGVRVSLGRESIELVGVVVSIALGFFAFAAIYKLLPFKKIPWSLVWGGALVAAILWELAKILFVQYLLNFARLSLVYGSIGVVIGLLVWGYITATILLFGAEFAAVNVRRAEEKNQLLVTSNLSSALGQSR